MRELTIGCDKSLDRMQLDADGSSVLVTIEAASGEQASVYLESADSIERLRDALTEWLERNA